ncbi:hypothetical protein AJ85_03160, partial [Alkalihalobacillus alcalophilus ATCC 27647 = CGMCC 1.3604]|uniref:DUF4352 domain-containing protein n=1 Tax=Alkalihalobacillus alcalophilus ATCC 27647 = CGMCC 1.3604 TaxID=1218173 RepID=A0A094WGS0_ALKAL
MKKTMKAVGITLLAGSLLVACNSEEGTDTSEDTTGSGGGMASELEFNDQLELGIGDTAQISSNLGAYEITIHSLKQEETVEDKSSMFDYFIVVDVTVKNIDDETLDASNPVGVLDQTSSLEGSGSGDYSQNYETIDSISGDLQPGEERNGQVLFHARNGEEQFIRIQPGLIAAGGVYNEAVWTFTEDEME